MLPKQSGLSQPEDIEPPIGKVDPVEAAQDDDYYDEPPTIPRKKLGPGRRFVEATVGPGAAAPPRPAPVAVIRSAADPAVSLLYGVVPPKLKPVPKGPSGQRAMDLLRSGSSCAGSVFAAARFHNFTPPPQPTVLSTPAPKRLLPIVLPARPAPSLPKSPPRKKPCSSIVDFVSEEEDGEEKVELFFPFHFTFFL